MVSGDIQQLWATALHTKGLTRRRAGREQMTRLAVIPIVAMLLAGCAQAAAPSGPIPASSLDVAIASPLASVVPTSEPPATPPSSEPCPISDTLTVHELLAVDPSCFGDRPLTVVGWAAPPPIFGVLPPGIAPRWLWWVATTEFVVWDHSRGSLSDLACSQGQCPPYLLLHTAPGTAINLAGWKNGVRLLGHFNDPAAETCHYVYPPDWTESPQPDSQARAFCRSAFVVTAIAAS
jgi:hypothetical protein